MTAGGATVSHICARSFCEAYIDGLRIFDLFHDFFIRATEI